MKIDYAIHFQLANKTNLGKQAFNLFLLNLIVLKISQFK